MAIRECQPYKPKNDHISLFDYLNALASNIEVTQFIDDDFAIDYEEV